MSGMKLLTKPLTLFKEENCLKHDIDNENPYQKMYSIHSQQLVV